MSKVTSEWDGGVNPPSRRRNPAGMTLLYAALSTRCATSGGLTWSRMKHVRRISTFCPFYMLFSASSRIPLRGQPSVQTRRGNESHGGRNAWMEAKTVFCVGKCHFPPTAKGAQPDLYSSRQLRADRAVSGISGPAGSPDDADVSDGLQVIRSPPAFLRGASVC